MLQDFVTVLNDIGFYTVLNPFILVFTLAFAILDKIKVLGDKRDFKISIAFVLGMLCIAPQFTGVGPDFVGYLNRVAPVFALLLGILFLSLLIVAMVGIKIDKDLIRRIVLLIVIIDVIVPDILILALIANRLGTELPYGLSYIQTSAFLNLVIAVVVFFAVVYFITRDEDAI